MENKVWLLNVQRKNWQGKRWHEIKRSVKKVRLHTRNRCCNACHVREENGEKRAAAWVAAKRGQRAAGRRALRGLPLQALRESALGHVRRGDRSSRLAGGADWRTCCSRLRHSFLTQSHREKKQQLLHLTHRSGLRRPSRRPKSGLLSRSAVKSS